MKDFQRAYLELLQIARSYRGDLAVVRALSRRERDAVNALRVV